METKTQDAIKETSLEILNKLKIESTVEVKENDGVYELLINTQDSGLLIGYHGNGLNSLQLIIATLIFKKLGEWKRVVVNVGDYRERREETLRNLAAEFAQEALTTKQTVILPYLTPSERRIVHLTLQDNAEVVSESQGEGKNRRLTIRPKDIN